MSLPASIFELIEGNGAAFCSARRLDAGLSDAFQALPKAGRSYSDSFPRTAYTTGDTSDQRNDDLPERLFAQLPSRAIRRYSPVGLESNGGQMQAPRPRYLDVVRKESEIRDALYPALPPRRTTREQLRQDEEPMTPGRGQEFVDISDVVAAPPGAAGLLAALGKRITRDALAGDILAARERLRQPAQAGGSARSFARESAHALICTSTASSEDTNLHSRTGERLRA